MGFFNRRREKGAVIMQTARTAEKNILDLKYRPLSSVDMKLYDALRQNVPIIDAAISKTVRLIGGFDVICSDKRAQKGLDDFLRNVNVGLSQTGMDRRIAKSSQRFDALLGRIEKLEHDSEILFSKVNSVALTQACVDEKLSSIIDTLSELKNTVNELRGLPQKRWEKIIASVITSAVTLLCGLIFGKMI